MYGVDITCLIISGATMYTVVVCDLCERIEVRGSYNSRVNVAF